jgi:hypothetical protein
LPLAIITPRLALSIVLSPPDIDFRRMSFHIASHFSLKPRFRRQLPPLPPPLPPSAFAIFAMYFS